MGNVPSGRAYRESYRAYIEHKGKQLLLAIIIYIDETSTGQFANLGYQPIKMSLGNFTEKVGKVLNLQAICCVL